MLMLHFEIYEGCKLEMISLNVEAVDTHRDKPSTATVCTVYEF